MTFDEWAATEHRSHGEAGDLLFAAEVMGYDAPPDDWVGAALYEHGVMVELDSGDWYTHVECDEYRGDFETVQRALWDWAKHECGGA